MDQDHLFDNITKLRQRVRRSSQKCSFHNRDILVLAVSKTRPAADLRAAYGGGLRDFGENYLQEALEKIEALADLDICWHFIGPIQSNKTRAIAENFDWVHSVDRARVAQRLNDQRPDHLSTLQICLQVNISGEESKSGVMPAQLAELVKSVSLLPKIQLRGLMAVPAPSNSTKKQQDDFAQLRELMHENQHLAPRMDTLSMGMSADMDAAISQGATILRIGTAIFGPRNG